MQEGLGGSHRRGYPDEDQLGKSGDDEPSTPDKPRHSRIRIPHGCDNKGPESEAMIPDTWSRSGPGRKPERGMTREFEEDGYGVETIDELDVR